MERLSKSNQKLKKHLDSEINIMKSLRHENIVMQYDVIVVRESPSSFFYSLLPPIYYFPIPVVGSLIDSCLMLTCDAFFAIKPKGTEYIYLILEYCEGGDFSEYLKQSKRLSEEAARHFLRQLSTFTSLVLCTSPGLELIIVVCLCVTISCWA